MFILEFPQNIFGFLLFVLLSRIKKYPFKKHEDAYAVHIGGLWGAFTLGKYIFADDSFYDTELIKHEYGHRIQSRLLSVLYLPLIGIPSLVWAGCFKRYRLKHQKSYYWFYTEAWANKLSGLDLR